MLLRPIEFLLSPRDVMVALKMMAFSRHLPSSEQLSLFLQLQGGTSSLQVLLLELSSLALCFLIISPILSMQL